MSDTHTEIINGYFELMLPGGDDPGDIAAFKTCSGLAYQTEIVVSEQNYAGGIRSYKKRPGRINYDDIEFERGLAVGSGELDRQLKEAEKGQPVRGTAAITLYSDDEEHKPVASWELRDAWISGWSLSDLDAESDDVLIQTLRITHSGMKREDK